MLKGKAFRSWASLVGQMVKNLPAVQVTRVWSLSQEDTLEKGMPTHSSILFFFNLFIFNWRIIASQTNSQMLALLPAITYVKTGNTDKNAPWPLCQCVWDITRSQKMWKVTQKPLQVKWDKTPIRLLSRWQNDPCDNVTGLTLGDRICDRITLK